jgi:hypothetical protein
MNLILFGIRRNYHRSGRNLLVYLIIKRVIKLTVVIIEATTYKILSDILVSRLTQYLDEIVGNHQCRL